MKRTLFDHIRMGIGLPVAAVITAILFLTMGALVHQDLVIVDDTGEYYIIDFIRDPPPPIREAVPDRPRPEPLDPPPARTRTETLVDRPDTIATGPIGPGTPTGTDIDITSTMMVATYKTAITFPDKCAMRGLEGEVIVEFDVTPDGSVINPRIISTTNSCFNRATLLGIRNWKYRPADGGGLRRNVRERIVYRLEA